MEIHDFVRGLTSSTPCVLTLRSPFPLLFNLFRKKWIRWFLDFWTTASTVRDISYPNKIDMAKWILCIRIISTINKRKKMNRFTHLLIIMASTLVWRCFLCLVLIRWLNCTEFYSFISAKKKISPWEKCQKSFLRNLKKLLWKTLPFFGNFSH